MREDFYRAFEEKYRGSRDMIKSRLKVYLPFIVPLKKIYANTEALDLGCGRGEWLELLGEEGFDAHGVDLDKGMLEACNDKNLSARVCDAVKALKEADSDSLVIVSAFHVVEHVSFEYLQNLVAEALRVLKPGGLLIIETPNPENLVVGTSSFYLDPTHQKPIPPQLLAFVPELEGFARTKILRLQESKDLAGNNTPGLNNVLDGVSPDYAVIAQKKALKKITNRFNKAFSQDYGLSLSFLAERFDNRFNQAEQKAGQAEQKAGQAEQKAGQAEQKAGQAEQKAGQAEQKAGQAEQKAGQAEQKAGQAEAIARQALDAAHRAEEQLMAIQNSRSWRITQPLRAGANVARWFKQGTTAWLTFAPQSRPRRTLRLALMHLKLYVSRRPRLKSITLKCLQPFPRLQERLKKVGAETQHHPVVQPTPEGSEYLTPYARRIYHDLKAAIEQRQKEQN
jgi:O-antigen chain-terminating methyltransferase